MVIYNKNNIGINYKARTTCNYTKKTSQLLQKIRLDGKKNNRKKKLVIN